MEQPTKQHIQKINELYIQTRTKYLVQFPERYVTLSHSPTNRVVKLNDGLIQTHLNGDLTYGIFSGGHFNKFITFDVDYADESTGRWATLKLVDTLVNDFAIRRSDIHVSLSGSKGYHVDLFFDQRILVSDLQAFYRAVLHSFGDLAGGQIEFRATWTQGVKLPLGIHQRTGTRCWFVDNCTLEPIETFDYILDIQPMDAAIISSENFGLTDEQITEFEHVAASTNTDVNTVDLSKTLQNSAKIIEAGRLTESGTRHKVTYTLALFGNSQGWEEAETVAVIMEILRNTPREYFSEGSTEKYWLSEAERLVRYVFEKDLTPHETTGPVTIYKSEILAVLDCGTFRQKQLAYAMLVTSKRYGRIFYLTIRTAMKMIGTKSKPTIVSAIKKLVDCGFIEYHRKAEVDRARSLELGQVRYKPNKYKLTIKEPQIDEQSVDALPNDSLVDVAMLLCDKAEIKRYVKRREYEGRWRGAM